MITSPGRASTLFPYTISPFRVMDNHHVFVKDGGAKVADFG
jgi:hypothetical protein